MTAWQMPPAARSRAACAFSAAAAAGRLRLQRCAACSSVCYPAREACPRCWSAELRWAEMPAGGTLLVDSTLHASFNGWFQARLPWRVGYVQSDAGPVVMAHLHESVKGEDRVRLLARTDSSGQGVLVALPETGDVKMADDPNLRTLTCDPRGRSVLVSDVGSPAGRAVAEALVQAGAARVFGGYSGDALDVDGIEAVRLDPTDDDSVARLVETLGGELDIFVWTSAPVRPGGVLDGTDLAAAENEMAVNCFGLLRLARAFGPALRERGSGDAASAWVNVLSVNALSGITGYGTSVASQAAALSLSQSLRAELAGSGVKVVEVLAGPLDDTSNAALPPPKVRPAQLGVAVVTALREGLERIAVGATAEDILQRFEEDPMAFEREELRP